MSILEPYGLRAEERQHPWKSWVSLLREADRGWAAKIQHRSPTGVISLPPVAFRTFGEIKLIIKNLLLKKIPNPGGLFVNPMKHLRKE